MILFGVCIHEEKRNVMQKIDRNTESVCEDLKKKKEKIEEIENGNQSKN